MHFNLIIMLLTDIPPELLMHVALYLSQNDLLSACRVCKLFYSNFIPTLYQEVTLDQDAEIQSLRRGLVHRSELSNFVKTLTLIHVTSSAVFENLSKKFSFPSLQELLWLGEIRLSDLKSVLLSAPNLRDFEGDFDFKIHILQHFDFQLSVRDRLLQCFIPIKSTLETLVLSMNFIEGRMISDGEEDLAIASELISFKEFENLSILEVPTWMIIGCQKLSQILPPKLAFLLLAKGSVPRYINSYRFDSNIVYAKIEEFLRDPGVTSHLKHLTCTFKATANTLDLNQAWDQLDKDFPTILDIHYDFDEDSESTSSGEDGYGEYYFDSDDEFLM